MGCEAIKVVLSNERGGILLGTVCYSKLTSYHEFLYRVQFFKPRGALKPFRNLDGVNAFNDSASVWMFCEKVELELDLLLFQSDVFRENPCKIDMRSPTIARNIEGPARSESVNHMNYNMISKTIEFSLERENFGFVYSALNLCHGLKT